MANIGDINEAWAGHSGLEVETFIKSQLMQVNQKFGYAEFNAQTSSIVFYDEEGGSPVFTLSLGGEIYDIVLNANVNPVFYVLADETEKIITFTPQSTLSYFGSTDVSDFPERHTYIVYVDTGSGYEPKTSGSLEIGATASIDIKQMLVRGNNYVRISVTGETSGKTKSFIFTASLTSLYLSCSHTWQSLWREGNDYIINGIHFAGNLVKYLRVTMTVNGTTVELPRVEYRANQSYTTTATTYTIQANKFPDVADNCIASITIWMEAQGISTPSVSYNIMCVKQASTTSLIAINDVVSPAVNYTSGKIFSYAVYLADSATFNMTALIGGNTYPATTQPVVVEELETGRKYDFTYSLEVDTGVDETGVGSLTTVGTPYANGVSGLAFSTVTRLDNSFSYPSTPGSLFYLNAAMRSNEEADYDIIKNEAGRSSDNNFAAFYTATWSGVSWANDGWSFDDSGSSKALVIPAGSSVTFNGFAPLSYISSYMSGMTIEMLIKCGYPSSYSTPVFEMSSGGQNPIGLFIYPTKITVIGSNESDEIKQSVMLSENTITHLVITFTRDYENVSTRNLCSIYVNGISNVNFAFDGGSSFGNGDFRIGHPGTDVYLYKMRVYGTALDSNAVLNNFLNSIMLGSGYDRREVFNKNQVTDVGGVDYGAVKHAGFNTMVITMTDDETPIPSIDNPAPDDGFQNCSIDFEYAGHPTWNVSVENVSIDGQGTTSKRYFRWNIRAKTSGSTVWSYGDGTSEDGKVGKFINTTGYIDVDRITAKKNIASSMQGHKMGMTRLYNDIFKQLGLGSHIPDENYQVAVYQFPFVGFRKYSDNTYEYIGLYTAGPDKGSKVTFGYNGEYPNLLSLEGPDHDPLATRFLHPWIDVDYSYEDETLTFGGEQGWDCDAIGGGLKTDKSSDAASVLALYESEWKPAYELVYHCSPYIASLSDALTEAGYQNIAAANADVSNFRKGSTNGVSNALLSFYDSNYDIWFYETKEGEYANLSTLEGGSDHNIKTYLGLTGSPTTAQIIAARATKFKSEAPSYWDIDQTLYHYCYCILFGVTDNFAKNTYPVKFRGFNETLENGESIYCKRWGWRQDDLDTILATDNNGRNTKPYYVEHGDTNVYGNELFQGGESALWVLIRDNYKEEIRQMMSSVISALDSIATRNGRTTGDLHDRIFSVVSLYCWEKSAKYFSQSLYESDRRWSYIEPWLINASKEYNNVHPLDQALGDEYQAEQLWLKRRIAYIFSKYRIGAFSGKETGYNGLSMTLAEQFEFTFTPAISLYPVASVTETDYPLGSYSPDSMRVNEGGSKTIVLPAGGASNNYLHGLDWMSSIGDLSGMVLTDRSTGETISFSIQSERLQELKVGDANPNNVRFNARSLFVKSPSLVSIDARYTSTVRNLVNLMECPRLRTCLFEGSMARGLYLPVGAKLTEVSFPAEASSIFLHSLPFLTEEGLTLPSLPIIQTLYINNCQSLAPFSIVEDILATSGNSLAYVTIAWRGVADGSISTLLALAELSGYVAFDNDTPTNVGGKPRIEGSVHVGNLYIDELETLNIVSEEVYQQTLTRALSNLFGTNLYIIYDPDTLWIRFADPAVETICKNHWDANHDGYLTVKEAKTVTTVSSYFSNNTSITSFDEFKYFTGMRTLGANQASATAFSGCSNLKSISLPEGLVNIEGTSSSGAYVNGITFRNCYSLERISFPSTLQRVGGEGGRGYVFIGCTKLARIDIVDLAAYFRITFENIRSNPFYDDSTAATRGLYLNGELITNLVVPSDITEIKANSFYRNNTITSVDIHADVTKIGEYAFNNCTSVQSFIVRATTPPNVVAMNALTNMPSFKIYVPYSSDHSVLDSYKSTSGWRSFSSKIYELDENGNIPT